MPILSYTQDTKLSLGNEFISSLLVEKNYTQAYTFFDESVKSKISEPLLKETVEKLEMQLGKFKSVIETTNENETYLYYADFEKVKLEYVDLFQYIICSANGCCTFCEQGRFFSVQFVIQNFFETIFANYARNTDANIVLTIFAFE